MIYKLYTLFVILMVASAFASEGVHAQALTNDSIKYELLSEVDSNLVKIRMAPISFNQFEKQIGYGVKVERYTVDSNGVEFTEAQYDSSETVISYLVLPESSSGMDQVNAPQDLIDAAKELIHNYQMNNMPPDTFDLGDIYKASQESENRAFMASVVAERNWELAKAMGYGVEDASAQPNMIYEYVITLQDGSNRQYRIRVDTDSENYKTLPKPDKLIKYNSYQITLDIIDISDAYFGYYVEMKQKGTPDTFQRVTDAPIVFNDEKNPNLFRYTDTLPDVENTYVFRMQGISSFGDLSEYSDTIHIKGKLPPIATEPWIKSVEEIDTQAKIKWGYVDSLRPLINGFYIYKSANRDGPFQLLNQQLLSSTDSTFIDDSVGHANYYFVEAIDTLNYSYVSMPHLHQPTDTIPPSIPTNIYGSIDYSGNVDVHWSPSPERDVKRYMVYYSYHPTENFISAGTPNLRDTFYAKNIELKTLTKYIYVKISAVDYRENESEVSDAIKLRLPDVVGPSKPVLTNARPYPGGVGLNWIYSTSEDVLHHIVERKVTNSGGWNSLAVINEADQSNYYQEQSLDDLHDTTFTNIASTGNVFRYIDTTVSGGIRYDYRIVAVDSSGNRSPSKRLDALAIPESSQGVVYNVACYKSTYEDPETVIITSGGAGTTKEYKERPATIVSWDYTLPDEVHSYIVYRSAGDKPFVLHKTYLSYDARSNPAQDNFNLIQSYSLSASTGNPNLPNGAAFCILDTDVLDGKVYRYKIVAKHFDGHYSDFSDIVEFTVSL